MIENAASRVNPFPSAAVAHLSGIDAGPISIRTQAIEDAFEFVDEHMEATKPTGLDRETKRRVSGNILAIVGDYGTGKTHLALQLLARLQGTDYSSTHTIYLDAPADTFLSLYRDRFLPRLSRRDVRERVMDFYSDVVADALGGSELTKSAADLLRSRRVSPDKVVENLGLMESEVFKALRQRLELVTSLKQFPIALTLLLRPEFEDAVWEWLTGMEPDRVLMERGITQAIDSEQEALEAIGVIALIYGTQGRTFVLVIDELEKVMSTEGDRRPEAAVVLAFKKLLEVFGRTQAFLILCGLPDFLEVLPGDVKQRIGLLVRPTALTSGDTVRYIEESQERNTGTRTLSPFTEDSVQYIVELASGNARKVIRFCYFAYRSASNSGTDVTRAMVRVIAREQFEPADVVDVKAEVLRTIDLNGWAIEENKRFGTSVAAARADFWLPAATGQGGIAIFVSQAILDNTVLKPLNEAAKAISKMEVPIKTVLIVNGYLADQQRSRLQVFDRVVIYDPRRFGDSFEATLVGFRKQLELDGQVSEEALLRVRLDELSRQGNSIRSDVEEVLRTSVSVRHVERAVESGIRRIFGQIAAPGAQTTPIADDQVNAVFSELESVLDLLLAPLSSRLVDAFEHPHANRRQLQDRSDPGWPLNEPDLAKSAAIAYCVLRALRAFKSGVGELLLSTGSEVGSTSADGREFDRSLMDLCVTFDGVAESLASLVDWSALLQSPAFVDRALDEAAESTEFMRRDIDGSTVLRAIHTLGPSVHRQATRRRRLRPKASRLGDLP